ncbi:MAG TPA: enoyl-CoA hydratase-related protein [Candidatus Saccharimonadales bacterium]|jgi:2-(1,2-epoxy-1,2-dihydrophenyl)acetyl-CoA isomerase|nr:enoyl-CoA hydratase-related protein [Candidatus Saccharimonadales bacterium]
MNTVLMRKEGAVCELTLNRPQSLNAFNDELMQDFTDAIEQIEKDTGIRCVVIKGAGPAFMAGGDIKMFHQQLGQSPEQLRSTFKQFVGNLHPLIEKLANLRVPVVAAVHGAVAGFGVSLTMLCDFVLVANDSFFTLAYVHLGTSPDGSSTYFLPRLVGLRRAKEIALLGDRIPAEEAVRLGLAYKAVPPASLEAETKALSARLAAGPTHAYANTKALLLASFDRGLSQQMDAETESFADCASGPDFAEGVKAFVERRKPSFTGK